MLREDRSIVLIDFGLAKRVDSDTHSTAVGVLRGSPYYMSPEQVRGLPLDPRSDLYSLGVVLYEMLTGRKPYIGTTAIELMEQHVAGKRALLPPELAQFEALLAPLMATEREDRFPDAATLLEALGALQQQLSQAEAAPELADVG
jgi:serine/threonine-protein kinase PpkA